MSLFSDVYNGLIKIFSPPFLVLSLISYSFPSSGLFVCLFVCFCFVWFPFSLISAFCSQKLPAESLSNLTQFQFGSESGRWRKNMNGLRILSSTFTKEKKSNIAARSPRTSSRSQEPGKNFQSKKSMAMKLHISAGESSLSVFPANIHLAIVIVAQTICCREVDL